MPESPDAWLLVVDPQVVFADPSSPWAVPRFGDAMAVVEQIAPLFGQHVLISRWIPPVDRQGSWHAYFQRWAFANRPADDPMFDIVPAVRRLSRFHTIDEPTFSKWGLRLRSLLGPNPQLVLTGCTTDCCVLATALAAADGGAAVTVIADACAGSSDANHAAGLYIMGLYDPQVRIAEAAEVLR